MRLAVGYTTGAVLGDDRLAENGVGAGQAFVDLGIGDFMPRVPSCSPEQEHYTGRPLWSEFWLTCGYQKLSPVSKEDPEARSEGGTGPGGKMTHSP